MIIRIRENIITLIIIGGIGGINIIKEIERINIINKKEIGISIIIIIIYKIINKWIYNNKELEIIIGINLLSLILLINNKNSSIGIIYLIIELYSMSIYILINYNNKKNKYINIIYFFISSISTLVILLIISIIYYKYGIIYINDFKYINKTESLINLNNILIFSLLFKLGVYPFYYWIILTYKEFDIKILLLQSLFTSLLPLYIILSLPFSYSSFLFIIIFSIINLIYIPIKAINSSSLKELLIFSSLFNLSFLLISSFSPFLFFYYFFFYLLNSFLVLFFILFPFNLTLLFLFLFSLIGFPPFSGFFIKLFLLFSSFNLSSFLSIPFIFFIILSSLLSANFYLKFINYFSLSSLSFIPNLPILNLLIISFFSLIILFFFFFHSFYFFLLSFFF